MFGLPRERERERERESQENSKTSIAYTVCQAAGSISIESSLRASVLTPIAKTPSNDGRVWSQMWLYINNGLQCQSLDPISIFAKTSTVHEPVNNNTKRLAS